MLCCPPRSPFSASRRLPGGTRRSSNRSAISSCRSFRRATAAMFTNLFAGSPFERAWVSAHLKVLITASLIVTDYVMSIKHSESRIFAPLAISIVPDPGAAKLMAVNRSSLNILVGCRRIKRVNRKRVSVATRTLLLFFNKSMITFLSTWVLASSKRLKHEGSATNVESCS